MLFLLAGVLVGVIGGSILSAIAPSLCGYWYLTAMMLALISQLEHMHKTLRRIAPPEKDEF